MALRRWKPFLGAFPLIDAAIEGADATDGILSRDKIRSSRARIVELLCNAEGDDDEEKAEALCALLDDAMAGSLATLRAVPAEKIPLAKGGLVGAVREMMTGHASERVRGLASDVVRGWTAGAEAELATATARARALASSLSPLSQDVDTAPAAGSNTKAKKILPEQPRPRKIAIVSSCRAGTRESYGPLTKKRAPTIVSNGNVKPPSANTGAPTLVPAQPKKAPPVAVSSAAEEKKKLEATKRKLQERYQEAEDAKRRRTIQVIKAPRPQPAQRKRNARPPIRAAERFLVKSRSLRV